MEFKSRKAAFRAMILSEILTRAFPSANQRFHANGDITILGAISRLRNDGEIVRVTKPVPNPVQVEARIASNAEMFEAVGQTWNGRNPQNDAYSGIRVRTDPDGTRILPDEEKPTVCGFDNWGPVERPARIADPAPVQDQNKALVRARMNANLAILHAARRGTVRVR